MQWNLHPESKSNAISNSRDCCQYSNASDGTRSSGRVHSLVEHWHQLTGILLFNVIWASIICNFRMLDSLWTCRVLSTTIPITTVRIQSLLDLRDAILIVRIWISETNKSVKYGGFYSRNIFRWYYVLECRPKLFFWTAKRRCWNLFTVLHVLYTNNNDECNIQRSIGTQHVIFNCIYAAVTFVLAVS